MEYPFFFWKIIFYLIKLKERKSMLHTKVQINIQTWAKLLLKI